mgnify:CR=1 FL=1
MVPTGRRARGSGRLPAWPTTSTRAWAQSGRKSTNSARQAVSRRAGPGQGDPLFPWLAEQAPERAMHWFLEQEVAGEAGFEDLVALTQVKLPLLARAQAPPAPKQRSMAAPCTGRSSEGPCHAA